MHASVESSLDPVFVRRVICYKEQSWVDGQELILMDLEANSFDLFCINLSIQVFLFMREVKSFRSP